MKSDHDKRRNNPIDDYAERDLDPQSLCLERTVQCLEANLAKYRVHHDQETNCLDRNQLSELVQL